MVCFQNGFARLFLCKDVRENWSTIFATISKSKSISVMILLDGCKVLGDADILNELFVYITPDSCKQTSWSGFSVRVAGKT